jgi:protein AaeX
MKFVEVDLFGVHVAPISVMMVVTWVAVAVLRRTADRFGLLRHLWHPALVAMGMTTNLEGGQGL